MAYLSCPHCGLLHDDRLAACPTTGQPLRRPSSSRVVPPAAPVAPAPSASRAPPTRAPAAAPVAPPGATPQPTSAKRPKAQPSLKGTIVGGKYRMLDILGEGGMGAVYEAENMNLGRRVAIKVLHPAQAKKKVAVKRFHQEARAAGRIGHPNICEVYDLGTLDDGSPYLVMEKLSGETLAQRIARDGQMQLLDAIDVLVQVLSGLWAAHEQGIIHRDIKPENVMLTARVGMPPIAKLLDFGVSKMIYRTSGEDDEGDLTKTGMVMGTPYYMSSEQARGERNLDGRVDVYACGVMLYEALTGKRPFTGKTYNALLMAILTSPYAPASQHRAGLPPDVDRVLDRAMARKRDERFGSAADFQQALVQLADALRGRSLATTPRQPIQAAQPQGIARPSQVSTEQELPRHKGTGSLPDLSSRGSGSDDLPVIVAAEGPYGPGEEATTPRKPNLRPPPAPARPQVMAPAVLPKRVDFDDVTIKQASPFDDVEDEGETRRVDSDKLSREAAAWEAARKAEEERKKREQAEADPFGGNDDATQVVDSGAFEEVIPAPPKRR